MLRARVEGKHEMVFADRAVDSAAYEDHASEPISEQSMDMLRALVREQRSLQDNVDRLDAELRAAERALAEVQEQRLPSLMEANGLESFNFVDETGRRFTVKTGERVFASIKCPHKLRKTDSVCDACRSVVNQWLVEIGSEGVIKNEVVAPFGPGSDEDAQLAVRLLQHHLNIEAGISKRVEPATLRAIVETRLREGLAVSDGIAVNRKTIADIKESSNGEERKRRQR